MCFGLKNLMTYVQRTHSEWLIGELGAPKDLPLTFLEKMVVHLEFMTVLVLVMGGVNTYRPQQARRMTTDLFKTSIS